METQLSVYGRFFIQDAFSGTSSHQSSIINGNDRNDSRIFKF